MPSPKPDMTLNDFAAIMARGSTLHYRHASIRVVKSETGQRWFYMEGRGCQATLPCAAHMTEVNALWVAFASLPLNTTIAPGKAVPA